MSETIGKRYAQALFAVAEKGGNIDEIENELLAVAEAFRDEDIEKFFLNPSLETSKKKAIVEALSGSVSHEVGNLLKVMIDNHREGDLQDIAKSFTEIANEARGIVDATVTTAAPLQEEEKRQLAEQFGNVLNKTLRIDEKVDSALIGGVLVRIGNRVYDGSIAGKLTRFKQRLMQVR